MANLCIKTPSSATYALKFQLLVLRPRPSVHIFAYLREERKHLCPLVAKFSPYGWDQVLGDLNQMTNTGAKTKQTSWCRISYITFPLATLIYWSLCLSFKSCALSHAWFLSFQNDMFHSNLMHSWKQLLVKICVVGKAEEVSVSNNQKFTTFWKTCFNFPRLRWQSMSYFSDYIFNVLGPNFLTPHCLYWRLHETLIWPGLIKAGYHLTTGANFVILVKSVS